MTDDNTYPEYADGDVTITVSKDLTLRLHSQKLRSVSSYFALFIDTATRLGLLPITFEPPPYRGHTDDDEGGSAFVVPLCIDGSRPTIPGVPNNNHETMMARRAHVANDAVFRALYKQPIADGMTAADFLDAAELAAAYGCLPAARAGLIFAVMRRPAEALYPKDPWSMLAAAYALRSKLVFEEAFIHVVGRWCEGEEEENKKKKRKLPNVVAAMVARAAGGMEMEVQRCWRAVTQLPSRWPKDHGIQGVLAVAVFRLFLAHFVGRKLDGSALRPGVYRVLEQLHQIDPDHDDVLVQFDPDRWLIERANGRGVQEGGTIVYQALSDYWFGYRGGFKRERERGPGLRSELEAMLRLIRPLTKPLFKRERHLGYFSYLGFEGPFPWEGGEATENCRYSLP
ncbi:hypothetical protein UCDDS831_g09064 [Diplodia seriata]|uniref:BTB domain-containing protein n=1 Tax=Diplodia seriata TaxID=420778 RepID=A0A0G2G884_9PEZI|nr:hypothetical protein UCDDS831_g09064 [Diplodia seriata]